MESTFLLIKKNNQALFRTKYPMENLDPFILITALAGSTFLLAAAIQYKFPPKKINHFYGYRTKTSMRNQECWRFAQRYSALQMMRTATAIIALGALSWGLDYSPPYPLAVGLGITVLFPAAMIVKIEKELKRQFPKDA